MRGGERSLRPAWIKAEYSVAAVPKQFIYLPDCLDPFLQKADCLFEGKSKVLFWAAIDVPFPPHRCDVKVLCIQCLQACLTNTDFDKVLVKTEASTEAWVGQSKSIAVLLFSFCIHKIRKCQLSGPESRWCTAHRPAYLGSADVYFYNVRFKESAEKDIPQCETYRFTWSLGLFSNKARLAAVIRAKHLCVINDASCWDPHC